MDLLFPLLIAALLIPMFLGIRRQKREMAKVTQLQDSVQVGDQVLTTSGLYGTVEAVDEETVDLEISEGIVTRWSRAAIREIIADDTDTDTEDDADISTDATAGGTGSTSTGEIGPGSAGRLTKD